MRVLEVVSVAVGGIVSMPLFFHTFDVRAKFTELFVEVLVAAIDVVNAVHLGRAFSF